MHKICVDTKGRLSFIFSDELVDLLEEGNSSIKRASHVEPRGIKWIADLSPVQGPTLGPFRTRSEALQSEKDWLENNLEQL